VRAGPITARGRELMAEGCLLYYITDRTQFAGDEHSRRHQLLDKVAEAAHAGVDFVQLREKDLPSRALEQLAHEALARIRQSSLATRNPHHETRLLINSRSDIALAIGADGVHLRSDDISIPDARTIAADVLSRNSKPAIRNWVVAVSCHTEEDVRCAAADRANFAVFAPVFEKRDNANTRPAGLSELERACRHNIRVLALGGVTIANAAYCLQAGAAGVAGIRLFQENDVAEVVRRIRGQ
jgi:thiamine-phosphate pyrophosphorylase